MTMSSQVEKVIARAALAMHSVGRALSAMGSLLWTPSPIGEFTYPSLRTIHRCQ